MELNKTIPREYPALEAISDAMKSPNDWEARHTDIGNGEWFPFTDWRLWGMYRIIGATMRRVYAQQEPSDDAPISYKEFLRVRASGEERSLAQNIERVKWGTEYHGKVASQEFADKTQLRARLVQIEQAARDLCSAIAQYSTNEVEGDTGCWEITANKYVMVGNIQNEIDALESAMATGVETRD
jgi:hypothetical protein